MSCDVANSPFSDSALDTSFDSKSHRRSIDLSAIHDFNSNFRNDDNQDPLDFGNANSGLFGLDQTYTPDSSINFYPDCTSSIDSPYYQSVEPSPLPLIPSSLRHKFSHRRSVSEPPDGGMLHHRPHTPEGAVVFHRDGHKLGVPAPRSSYASPSKRVKLSRGQPYARSKTGNLPQNQGLYQLRRSHTQPFGKAPTSMPPAALMQRTSPMPHFGFEPLQEVPQFAVSRVCTPAPEAVDPMLVMPVSPAAAFVASQATNNEWKDQNFLSGASAQRAVVIKISIDELRALMTEVVQKVFDGANVQRPTSAEEVCSGHEDTDMGDESIVAARSVSDAVESLEGAK